MSDGSGVTGMETMRNGDGVYSACRCDISSDFCILPNTVGDTCSYMVLHPCIMSGSYSSYCEISDSKKVESVILSS